jgi:hypothetical protein
MISIILSIATSFAYATSLTEAFSPVSQRNVPRDIRLQPIHIQLNLIPLSQAWDFLANSNRPETIKCETFVSLVPQLGCELLDSNGALTTSAAGDYKLYLAIHVDDLPPLVELTLQLFDATAIDFPAPRMIGPPWRRRWSKQPSNRPFRCTILM